ncbi:MAG: glucose-1-phosphate adenylyltransferase [Candidatus Omnitrophica bacterium]|nr:glucose-1-phosphate adenylyltransferase [Candidatus Omnitrophota bacterium]
MKDVLCLILGGGRGARLYPLTKYRAKPAVPLAGKYRLVDIPISNCLNSSLNRILILTQFNSASLNKHITRTYKLDSYSQGFVEILAAEQSMEQNDWFQGSADAVRKCLKHFNDTRIKHILILSGDQLYKMDFNYLINFHNKENAEITIACNPVERQHTPELGIMTIGKNQKIKDFIEKPGQDKNISRLSVNIDGKEKFLASMGIYYFKKDILFDLLSNNTKFDFGKEVIPDAIKDRKTYAYIHTGYWKDIGTVQSFYEENLAFTQDLPPLNLFDEEWPFYTRPRYLPLSKINNSTIMNSKIAEGVIIKKAQIKHSIIGLRSFIDDDTVIEDSIVMGNDYYGANENNLSLGIGRNCFIKKAIVDKNVKIGSNVKITNKNNTEKFENEFCVIRNGITVIPKGTVVPDNTEI